MPHASFQAPSLEAMNTMLPAFEFSYVLSSNEVGAVYHATQKSLDREVAIKLFSPKQSENIGFMSKFTYCSSSVAGLRHPNLISLYDSGSVEGMSYLVMEFVAGKSLARSTKGNSIEFSQAMAIIEEVCDALAYTHEKHLTHGYLNPLNILLTPKASPKIGNFGLGHEIHTAEGVEVPRHFTAPEVIAGEYPNPASDLYSVAALFYELITGTPYRPGAPAASKLEGTPVAVDRVIQKAAHSDPKERGEDVGAFFKDLKKAATPKKKAPVAPASPSPAVAVNPKDAAQKLIIKVVVILVLLVIIQQVWSHRKAVLAKRAQGSEQTEGGSVAQEKARKIELARIHRLERQQQAQTQAKDPEPFAFPEDAETPFDSLERLRDSLKQGGRTEMPIGTVQQGSSQYFLVTRPMTWNDAATFALDHGGHLALPESDMNWRTQEPMAESSFWIGMASSGPNAYTRIDGSAFPDAAAVFGSEPFVYLDEGGAYRTASASTAKPFVIQWQQDGSQPATLEKQLVVTASSLKGSTAIYPPGTISEGERRFLPVSRTTTWEQARQLAKSGGGHLMVLSTEEERAKLDRITARLGSAPAWMGGHLVGDFWCWATDEPWIGVTWLSESNAAEDGAATIVRSGRGVDAMGKSDSADGFIIEWSKDPETNKPNTGAPTFASATDLADKAKALVIAAGEKKEAAHIKNTEKIAWDLDARVRGLKKSDQDRLVPEFEKLKGCVRDNRLYKETIEAEEVRLSSFMSKLCNYVIEKQAEIDENYATELKVIHAHYLKTIGEIRDQAKAAGQVKIQMDADGLIQNAQNQAAWLSAMGAP